METTDVNAVFVFENEYKPKTFSVEELNDLIRHLALSNDKKRDFQHLVSKNSVCLLTMFVLLISERKIRLCIFSSLWTEEFVSVITLMCYFVVRAKNKFHLNSAYSLIHLRESLKAIRLLHNSNKKSSISIRYSVPMKECYENIHVHLDTIKYTE